MKIDHIGMYTFNLEKTRNFFMKYFSAESGDLYHNKNTNFKSYFLTFEDKSRLEIMQKPEINIKSKIKTLGYAHIAFNLGSKENVDKLTKILEKDGYIVSSYPRKTGDGYYESCILDIDGNEIELTI